MSRRRLIIFAREPEPGRVKTRLCPPLQPEDAARLAEAFLLDELETFAAVPELRTSVAYTPPAASATFRRLLGDEMIPWMSPQTSGDLGDRLLAAFGAACPTWWPVAVIGSDSPDLPPRLVLHALDTLEHDLADVVLGPAVDGGFYLVAARQAHPSLFEGIPWSTAEVFSAVQQRAEEARLRVRLLPLWEDVDDIEDLRRLAGRLKEAEPMIAPRTRAVLRSLRL